MAVVGVMAVGAVRLGVLVVVVVVGVEAVVAVGAVDVVVVVMAVGVVVLCVTTVVLVETPVLVGTWLVEMGLAAEATPVDDVGTSPTTERPGVVVEVGARCGVWCDRWEVRMLPCIVIWVEVGVADC